MFLKIKNDNSKKEKNKVTAFVKRSDQIFYKFSIIY